MYIYNAANYRKIHSYYITLAKKVNNNIDLNLLLYTNNYPLTSKYIKGDTI